MVRRVALRPHAQTQASGPNGPRSTYTTTTIVMEGAQPQPGGDERWPRSVLLQRVNLKKQEIQPGNLGPLATRADLTSWLAHLGPILQDIGVPQEQFSEASILFVEDDAPRSALNKKLVEKGDEIWQWYDFVKVLYDLLGACVYLLTLSLAQIYASDAKGEYAAW